MPDLNLLVYPRGGQRFIVAWTDDQLDAALRTIGRWACDTAIDFNWVDAARVCRRMVAMQGEVVR